MWKNESVTGKEEKEGIVEIKRIFNFIITNPVAIAITVFIVVTIIVISLSFKHYDSVFGLNVLVEAHGMLFDILVIGILILFLNRLAEKRIANQRYEDEIDDFRDWKEMEAAYRIAGNIKRLNKNGFKGRINLGNCYLKDTNLAHTNLNKANLRRAILQGVLLNGADLQGAILHGADLQGANLNANLWVVTSLKSKHTGAANLQGANLTRANLSGAGLQGAILHGADLQGARNLTLEQLSKVKTLYEAKLDPELMEQVKEKCPHLLEEPKPDE